MPLRIEKQLSSMTIDDTQDALKNSVGAELAEKDVNEIRQKTYLIQLNNVENGVTLKIQSQFTQFGESNEIIEVNQSVKGERESRQPCENTDSDSESDTATLGHRYTATNIYGHEREIFSNERKSHGTKGNKKSRAKNAKIKESLKQTVHKNLSPASPSASCTELCRISDDVMMRLQVVRDNGQWDAFEERVVKLSQKYVSREAQIVILLEQSMAACYRNNPEESEKMIKTAIVMSKDVENGAILQGRANDYLSGVYRRQSLTGKADACLQIAEQNFDNSELTQDSIFVAYERASVLMDFISKCPYPKASLVDEAKANLVKCIAWCIALEEDSANPRYVKKHHFAFIKIAMLLLDCRTAAGRRERVVSGTNIREAEQSLATLRTRYWDGIAQGEKVQYFLGLADLNFRRENFSEAEINAEEALAMATKYSFNTEIKPAQDRLEDIRKRSQNEKPRIHAFGDVTIPSDTSDAQHGDVSSCCKGESDGWSSSFFL